MSESRDRGSYVHVLLDLARIGCGQRGAGSPFGESRVSTARVRDAMRSANIAPIDRLILLQLRCVRCADAQEARRWRASQAFRNLRRSSSAVPPHTPDSWLVARANSKHSVIDSQMRQI